MDVNKTSFDAMFPLGKESHCMWVHVYVFLPFVQRKTTFVGSSLLPLVKKKTSKKESTSKGILLLDAQSKSFPLRLGPFKKEN